MPITVALTVKDSNNNVVTGFNGAVTASITSGTGTAGATLYNGTSADAVIANGVVTFEDLSLVKVGTGYSLTFSTSGLNNAVSSTFAITVDDLDHLMVVLAASTTNAGATLSFTVKAVDFYENTRTDFTGPVSFSTTDAAVLSFPTSYTYVTGDLGSRIFNGSRFVTAGEQTILANDYTNGFDGAGDLTVVVPINSTVKAVSLAVVGDTSLPAVTSSTTVLRATLKDAYNNLITNSTTQATLTIPTNGGTTSSSNPQGTGADGTASWTLAASTVKGTYTYTVKVSASPTPSATTTLNFVDPIKYTIVSVPSSTTAGNAFDVIVECRNISDSSLNTSCTNNFKVTSTDAQFNTVTYNFVGASGQKTISVNLKTSGAQTLTATDPSSPLITGTSSAITVSPGPFANFAWTVPNSRPNSTANVTVRVSDAYGNTVAASKTITLTSAATAGGATGNVVINGTTNIKDSNTSLTTEANGILSFSYNIDASNSYRFTVVGDGVTSNSPYFGVGIDLIVPIEMTDLTFISSKNGVRTWENTMSYFNSSDYADSNLPSMTTYSSEAICKNAMTSAVAVSIVDNSSPAGAIKGSIVVPASTSAFTRVTGTFTPTAGAGYYRVSTPLTSTDKAVTCHTIRMIVKQTYASKTAIYYPMTNGLWSTTTTYDKAGGTYGVNTGGTNNIYSNATTTFTKSNTKSVLFRKETDALSGNTIEWYPEAVISLGNTTAPSAQIALYNETTATMVGSAITDKTAANTNYSRLYRAASGIADSSLTDGDDFAIRFALTSGTTATYLYKAGLWAKVSSNLQKARVLHRVGRASATSSIAFTQDAAARAAIDLTAFKGLTDSSSAYLDATGYCNSSTSCSGSKITLLDHGTSNSTISTTPVYGNTNGTTAVSTPFSNTTSQRIKSTDTLKLATPASPGERVSASVGLYTTVVAPFVVVDTE
jgi:hypothetical protein